MSISVYRCKDGRERVYIKETKKVISYPKYLMEQELGRSLAHNEEVHHKDRDPLNNDLSNLEIRIHGEHQAEHATKYHDRIATCGWCGKEFLWTAKQQRTFNGNTHRGDRMSEVPFCSRQCSGHYGQQIQIRDCDNRNPRRKLTDEQARYIRAHYKPYDSLYGITALAAQFGVSRRVIDGVLHGKTYRNCM